ncbi:hypothetical protein H671_6g15460 [Cricetulus griseus]|uniref:Uncharacterized protein n=1 Tax=Cricetulus griseus TaxID=10029 RepID=A0A061I2J9_CRIGR|nr:hypothetical protein H671_6g15460 [Cricetulus griseus]
MQVCAGEYEVYSFILLKQEWKECVLKIFVEYKVLTSRFAGTSWVEEVKAVCTAECVFPCNCFKQSVYMVYYIDGFSYVKPSLHPWDEAYLITVDDFSDMILYSICQDFIVNFRINVHEGY